MRVRFSALCLLLLCTAWAMATPLSWSNKEFMGVDEITPGMKGYGKTVFAGTKIEKFDIEVIAVMRNMNIDEDMILIRVTSGPVVTRNLHIVEGMSGSPIYINDRLIGAYAYGWGFQSEAIAGVTPIGRMLEDAQPGCTGGIPSSIPPRPLAKPLRIGTARISQVCVAKNALEGEKLQAEYGSGTMVLRPLESPLLVQGMTDAQLKPMQDFFAQYNLRAVAVAGGKTLPSAPTTAKDAMVMQPGSALSLSFTDGDLTAAAIGTVTYVRGTTLLGFGHPMFTWGKTNIIMALANIYDIIPNAQASFKLGVPVVNTGTIIGDYPNCVVGEIGKDPQAIPVDIHLSNPSNHFLRNIHFRVCSNIPMTTQMIYFFGLSARLSTLAGSEQYQNGAYTAKYTIDDDVYGTFSRQETVQITPVSYPVSEVAQLIPMLQLRADKPNRINSVRFDVSYNPATHAAMVERVVPDRQVARPGETINFSVYIKPFQQPTEIKTFSVTVPKNACEPLMMVIIGGGWPYMPFHNLLEAPYYPEEGLAGVIRFGTHGLQPTTSMLVGCMFPAATLNYRGEFLRFVPSPIIDQIRAGDVLDGGSRFGATTEGIENVVEGLNRTVTPTLFDPQIINLPYLLMGGMAVPVAIDVQDRRANMQTDSLVTGAPMPLFSTSTQPAAQASAPTAAYANALPWMTPLATSAWNPDTLTFATNSALALPTFRFTGPNAPMAPLSLLQDMAAISKTADKGADDPTGGKTPPPTGTAPPTPPATTPPTPPAPPTALDLLSKAPPSWSLANAKDFQKGTHIGTTVSSKGRLLLAPAVRALYRTTEMMPRKMVATANGVYVIGWKSNHLLCLTGNNDPHIVFAPESVTGLTCKALTALAADADGNLLLACWPKNHVLKISPTGDILQQWALPEEATTWALAVTTNGRIYAAESAGTLLTLDAQKIASTTPLPNVFADNAGTITHVAFVAPDRQIYCLATGKRGDLYFATYPRGKVFHLAADGELDAVFEAKDSVCSLAVDAAGYLFIGTSPSTLVVRIAPDGTRKDMQVGTGGNNQHVMALQALGDDVYAATAPNGGIYCVRQADAVDPEILSIYAREDLRRGLDDANTVGVESVMVNDLTVTPQGKLLAAASTPGQIFQLEPRAQGDFLSNVIPTPQVEAWGALDVQYALGDHTGNGNTLPAQIQLSTRTGSTFGPDQSWTNWQAPREDGSLGSPVAGYAQVRIHLTDSTANPAVDFLRTHYYPQNQPPTVKLLAPTVGAAWSGKQDIRWEGKDKDNDELVYQLSYGREGQAWTVLDLAPPAPAAPPTSPKATPATPVTPASPETPTTPATPAIPTTPSTPATPITATISAINSTLDTPTTPTLPAVTPSVPPTTPPIGPVVVPTPPVPAKPQLETNAATANIDSAKIPDGVWRIKVTASDKYAHPTHPASAEDIVGSILIDNTPPTATIADRVTGWDAAARFTVADNLSGVFGGKFRLDGGPWVAMTPASGHFGHLTEEVQLLFPDGPPTLTAGEHKLEIVLQDVAGNHLSKTVTVVVP